MIHIEEKKIEPDDRGNDINVSIKVNCESMKDVLREYSFLTAHIRDMLILSGLSDTDKIKGVMFAAFKAGMDDIPHTKDAQLVIDSTSQYKNFS